MTSQIYLSFITYKSVTLNSSLLLLFIQKSSLSTMLYLADNLAYIPYTVVDEPLYVIHQIDIMISVSGSNLLQTFKEVNGEIYLFIKGML